MTNNEADSAYRVLCENMLKAGQITDMQYEALLYVCDTVTWDADVIVSDLTPFGETGGEAYAALWKERAFQQVTDLSSIARASIEKVSGGGTFGIERGYTPAIVGQFTENIDKVANVIDITNALPGNDNPQNKIDVGLIVATAAIGAIAFPVAIPLLVPSLAKGALVVLPELMIAGASVGTVIGVRANKTKNKLFETFSRIKNSVMGE